MQEIISTRTGKGQVTIPVAVRRHLGVGINDKVTFVLDDNGEVRLRAPHYPTIESLRGIAGSLDVRRSWTAIKEIAQDDHAQDVASSQ